MGIELRARNSRYGRAKNPGRVAGTDKSRGQRSASKFGVRANASQLSGLACFVGYLDFLDFIVLG